MHGGRDSTRRKWRQGTQVSGALYSGERKMQYGKEADPVQPSTRCSVRNVKNLERTRHRADGRRVLLLMLQC